MIRDERFARNVWLAAIAFCAAFWALVAFAVSR